MVPQILGELQTSGESDLCHTDLGVNLKTYFFTGLFVHTRVTNTTCKNDMMKSIGATANLVQEPRMSRAGELILYSATMIDCERLALKST